MENILGTKLADRYLIEELVGVGGMCNVCLKFVFLSKYCAEPPT